MLPPDVAPPLLERLRSAYRSKTSAAPPPGDGWVGANDFGLERGKILAEVFDGISPEDLPDGRMYFNIADRVVRPLLEEEWAEVVEFSAARMEELQSAAGIGIRALRPEADPDRVMGFINRISSEESFADIKWMLQDPVVLFSQTAVESTLEANVELQSEAGIPARISRRLRGPSCEWCRSLAGNYTYPDVPREVFARHDNCDCIIDYTPGKPGKVSPGALRAKRVSREVRIAEREENRLREVREQFPNASPVGFGRALAQARSGLPESMRWRVSKYSPEELLESGAKLWVSPGGSTVAVKPSGDIVSVCRSATDDVRGSELLSRAVKAGGDRLDSFSGNHKFYTKNGFEPVSWCEFDPEFAPDGWKPEFGQEPIIFYRHTGVPSVAETAEEFCLRVSSAGDYSAAESLRNRAIDGGS